MKEVTQDEIPYKVRKNLQKEFVKVKSSVKKEESEFEEYLTPEGQSIKI